MKNKAFVSPELQSQTIEELSRQLLEANNKLTMMQTERTVMLANISHDLRAPITAIRSSLDLLNSGNRFTEEEVRKTVALIDRRTTTLEALINDMYYLFCVEDTSRSLDIQEIDAGPFLEEYFYDATVDARYDEHDCVLDVPESLDCKIHVDPQKMVRVLDNLFTNAAKYTPAGTRIVLYARLDSDSLAGLDSPAGYNKLLTIVVEDNGPGIPADSLPHIFTRTYTVSNVRTPGKSSSGLGLSIAKTIIDRFDGSIICRSSEGAGCKFIITLPAF